MPPWWTHSPMTKPSSTAPVWTREWTMALPALEQAVGEPARQAVVADALGCRLDVVADAAIGQLARLRVKGEKAGRRIVIAGLADRARAREPLPALEELHRHARGRHEARHLGGDRHRIERRQVDVAAETDLRLGRDHA